MNLWHNNINNIIFSKEMVTKSQLNSAIEDFYTKRELFDNYNDYFKKIKLEFRAKRLFAEEEFKNSIKKQVGISGWNINNAIASGDFCLQNNLDTEAVILGSSVNDGPVRLRPEITVNLPTEITGIMASHHQNLDRLYNLEADELRQAEKLASNEYKAMVEYFSSSEFIQINPFTNVYTSFFEFLHEMIHQRFHQGKSLKFEILSDNVTISGVHTITHSSRLEGNDVSHKLITSGPRIIKLPYSSIFGDKKTKVVAV